MNPARRNLSLRSRNLLRSASVVLALLFVLLRPACEVFAASAGHDAPATPGYAAAQSAAAHADGHPDDGICCAGVDAQALTAPAGAPLAAMSLDMLVTPSSARLLPPIPFAAPPRAYHARSLRRLD